MNTVFRTDSIVEFSVYSNSHHSTYVYVPHSKYVIERRFLPDKLVIIKSGWYRKENIDENMGIPININNCKPFVEEEKNVFLNSYETHDENWIHFNDSNFVKHLNDCFYYEFMEDSENRITEIDLFDIGTIEIKTYADDWTVVSKNISEKEVDGFLKKIAMAIETYPFFKVTDDKEIVFFSASSGEEFKI